jgi:hypothetical protein
MMQVNESEHFMKEFYTKEILCLIWKGEDVYNNFQIHFLQLKNAALNHMH